MSWLYSDPLSLPEGPPIPTYSKERHGQMGAMCQMPWKMRKRAASSIPQGFEGFPCRLRNAVVGVEPGSVLHFMTFGLAISGCCNEFLWTGGLNNGNGFLRVLEAGSLRSVLARTPFGLQTVVFLLCPHGVEGGNPGRSLP